MISHRMFDSVQEALIAAGPLNAIKFSIYCLEDCLKFTDGTLKEKLTHNLTILKSLIEKGSNSFNKFAPISESDFHTTEYLLEDMWDSIMGIYSHFKEFEDYTIDEIYSMYIRAITLYNRLGEDQADVEQEKKYFTYINSYSNTNTLKDSFF